MAEEPMYQISMQGFMFERVENLIENSWPTLEVVEIPVHEEGVRNYIITPREL